MAHIVKLGRTSFGRMTRLFGLVAVLMLGFAVPSYATPPVCNTDGTVTITQQPVNVEVTANNNESATFTVTANDNNGCQYVNIQWQYLNGNTWTPFGGNGELNGASLNVPHSYTVTTDAMSAQNGLKVSAIITDPGPSSNSVTTNTVILQVDSPPSVTTAPSNDVVAVGTPANFSVVVAGVPTPAVQWQYSTDGNTWFNFPSTGTVTQPSLLNSLTGTLATPNVTPFLDGSYFRAVLSNTLHHADGSSTPGSANSATANLYVVKAPTINSGATISNTLNNNAYEGTFNPPITFSVSASNPTEALTAAGTGTLSYQWYQGTPPNGTSISQPTSSWTLPTPVLNNAGTYYAVVTYNVTVNTVPFQTTSTSAPVNFTVTPGYWKNAGTLPTGVLPSVGSPLSIETFTRSTLLSNGLVMAIGSDFNDQTNDATDTHSTQIYLDLCPGMGGEGGNGTDNWVQASVALPQPLQRPTVTLLPTGDVLIAGGQNDATVDQAGSYLFTNTSGTASSSIQATTHAMNVARDSHTASLLNTGKVLVTGGASNGAITNTTELYDPSAQTWTLAAPMNFNRYRHTATVLKDGTVLVTGGQSGTNSITALKTAEIYNPATNTWTQTTGNMTTARVFHTATLLPNGTVLIAGGTNAAGTSLQTAEIYNPATQTFTLTTGSMVFARNQHTATLMANGMVLLTGGASSLGYLNQSELYNFMNQTFVQTQSMTTPRDRSSAVLVHNGKVLAIGGTTTGDVSTNSTEKFNNESEISPKIPNPTITINGPTALTADSAPSNHTTATCSVTVNDPTITYVWTVLNGVINTGQGTATIDFSPLPNATGVVTLYCLASGGVGVPTVASNQEEIFNATAITVQPVNQNVVANGSNTATFTVTVTGNPAPTVQWQYSRDGNTWYNFPAGSGTMSTVLSSGITYLSTLTTNPVVEGLNGAYFRAVATNPVDGLSMEPVSTTSNAVYLGVNLAPSVSVVASPANGIVDQNGTVTLTAMATGDTNPSTATGGIVSANYTYAWYGPNGLINGQTSNQLVLNGIQGSATGNYYVIATNNLAVTGATPATTMQSSANSNSVMVSVQTPAQVVSGPANEAVLNGNQATFSVQVSGNPVPTVSWQYSRDGNTWFNFPYGTMTQPNINSLPLTGSVMTAAVTPGLNGVFFRAIASNTSLASQTNYSSDSPSATLTVIQPPGAITVTPPSGEISQGGNITFTASSTAAGSGQNVTYVWCQGATPQSATACTPVTSTGDVSVNGASLTVSNAKLADATGANPYYVQAYDASVSPSGTNSALVASSSVPLIIDVGTWSLNGTLDSPRYQALSMMLPTTSPTAAKFWIAGGQNDNGLLSNDDLYTTTGQNRGWAPSGNSFAAGPHLDGTATLLPNGNVLIVAGDDGQDGQYGIESFNTVTKAYTADTVTLPVPTTEQTAAFLPNQKVLIAGGSNGWSDTFYNGAYLFTPGTPDTVASSSSTLSVARGRSASVVLADGRVLITGGQDVGGVDNAVDIYDAGVPSHTYNYNLYTAGPTGGTGDVFEGANCAATTFGNVDLPNNNLITGHMCMNSPRMYHTATLLNDGRVLIVGGTDGTNVLSSIEIWDPTRNNSNGGFTVLGQLATGRMAHSAVLLETGKVLVFGGEDANGNMLHTSELIDPNYGGLSTGVASVPAGPMNDNRLLAESTALVNGSVLVAGGVDLNAAQNQTQGTSEDFAALENYSPPLDESATVGGMNLVVTPSSTGNPASIGDSGNGYFTHYTWTVTSKTGNTPGTNGVITSGQGTNSIQFTAGSGTQSIATALVTDQWGQSQYVSGTSLTPCPQPTSTGITVTYGMSQSQGHYVATKNQTIFVYLNNFSAAQGSTYKINWQSSPLSLNAQNTNNSTSGDGFVNEFHFDYTSTGNGNTLTATVTVTCSNNTVSTPKVFTLSPTINVGN